MAKTPKKSGVPPTRANTVIHDIADVHRPLIAVSYVNTVEGFTDSIPTKTIEDLLKAGAFDALDTSIPWRELHQKLSEGEVSEDFVRALTQSADKLSAATAKLVKEATGVKPILTFDSQNAEVRRFINEQTGELATSTTEGSRKSIKEIITRSLSIKTTIGETAAQIKAVIGLRPDQAKSMSIFGERLEAQGLKRPEIRRRMAAFAKQKLAERADMIARTESMIAVNGGHQVGWNQAADQGLFDPETATVRWIVVGDAPRMCPTCESMEDLPRPFKGRWKVRMLRRTKGGVVKTGQVKFVKIPNTTHPNCRCTMVLDINAEDKII